MLFGRYSALAGRGIRALAAALCLLSIASCTVLNPALIGTLTPTGVLGLDNPQGTILIALFNETAAGAAARVEIVKKSGGSLELAIPVQAANNDPTDDTDRSIVVQDCDVQSIQLVDVLIGQADGTIQQLASDRPPLTDGLELSCGKVVIITLTGTAPNFLVTLAVY